VFRWRVNLHNLFHFLRLREDAHAQYEIRVYAEAIHDILKEHFPVATAAYEQHIQERITISPDLARNLAAACSGGVLDTKSSELNTFLARFQS
jgi:thymidylate synthase (FAD)